MTKKEKVINILEILNEKFGKPECALKYNTPFELLVAVILSAQVYFALRHNQMSSK